MRLVVFRCQNDTRGFLIEAVDYPRAFNAANATEVFAVRKEGMNQGSGAVARGWMDDHTCWFVDRDQVFVFVEHIEGDCLGGEVHLNGIRDCGSDPPACFNFEAWFHEFHVAPISGDCNQVIAYVLLSLSAAHVRKLGNEPSVEAFASVIVVNSEGVTGAAGGATVEHGDRVRHRYLPRF